MKKELYMNRLNGLARFTGRLAMYAIAILSVANIQAQTAENPAKTVQSPTINLDTDPSLIGWWKFDDSEGSTTQDSSPGKHPGKLEGGLTFAASAIDGKFGKALLFNGKENYLTIPGCKGVTGTSPRTVVAWIKTTKPGGEILSWGTEAPGKKWTFGFIRGRVGVTPRGGYFYMKQDIHNDQWHQVAVVVAEASPPNLHDHVKLFKDGELAEIDDIGLLDMYPIETGDKADVRIGWRFNGALDDVRIYQRALSEDEIKSLFNKKSP